MSLRLEVCRTRSKSRSCNDECEATEEGGLEFAEADPVCERPPWLEREFFLSNVLNRFEEYSGTMGFGESKPAVKEFTEAFRLSDFSSDNFADFAM